jgi:hypothetical protein
VLARQFTRGQDRNDRQGDQRQTAIKIARPTNF